MNNNSKQSYSDHGRVTDASSVDQGGSETLSPWTNFTFRNLVPRSDVSVVTLPLEGWRGHSGQDEDEEEEEEDVGHDTRRRSNNNNTKRILHFVIGGETTETSESNIVESIEWTCRRSWRMASLNRPRIGCGAALLRGVIYTVGGLSNDSTVLSSVEKYSFFKEEKRWELLENKSNMKTARWGHAVVALPRKNAIFAIGGRNSSWQELSSVEVAQQSPSGDLQWNRLPYGMRQKRFGAAVVSIGDSSFLTMGGFDGSRWTRTVVLYEVDGDDIRDGMWTEFPDMPRALVFGKAVVTKINNENFVFVAGATIDGDSVLQVFEVKERIWAVIETDGGEEGCSLAMEGDNLLCIGGGSNRVRCLDLSVESYRGTLGALCCSTGVVVEVSAVPVHHHEAGQQSTNEGRARMVQAFPEILEPSDSPPRRPEPDPEPQQTPPLRFVENVDCVVDGEQAVYTGEVNAVGQRHGKGVLLWPDASGNIYPKALSKNSFYEGQFHEDFRKGKGIFYVQEEARLYEGNFDRGVLFGQGKLTDVNRNLVYEGGFRKGMCSGEGRCQYQDTGRTFVGIWKRGRPLTGKLLEVDGRIIQSGNGPWSLDLAVDLSRAGPNASSAPLQISRPMSSAPRSSVATVPHSNRAALTRNDPPPRQSVPSPASALIPASTPEPTPQATEVPQANPPQTQPAPSHAQANHEPLVAAPVAVPNNVEKRDCMVEDEHAQYTGPLNALGQRHGRGLLVWADEQGNFYPKEAKKNTYYAGDFYEDSRSGNGIMFVKEENRTYQGMFERGVLTGEGILKDARRDLVYEGLFKKGTPHGEGKAVYGMSNRVFIGRWRKGQPVSGKLYNNQGQLLQQGNAGLGVELAID